MSFMDVFKHETFRYKVETNHMSDSQEYIEFLIEKVYPHCKPNNDLPSDIIAKRDAFYKEKRELNPDIMKPALRFREFYDNKFGQGYYDSKFGALEMPESNAKPWDWNSFQYK